MIRQKSKPNSNNLLRSPEKSAKIGCASKPTLPSLGPTFRTISVLLMKHYSLDQASAGTYTEAGMRQA